MCCQNRRNRIKIQDFHPGSGQCPWTVIYLRHAFYLKDMRFIPISFKNRLKFSLLTLEIIFNNFVSGPPTKDCSLRRLPILTKVEEKKNWKNIEIQKNLAKKSKFSQKIKFLYPKFVPGLATMHHTLTTAQLAHLRTNPKVGVTQVVGAMSRHSVEETNDIKFLVDKTTTFASKFTICMQISFKIQV